MRRTFLLSAITLILLPHFGVSGIPAFGDPDPGAVPNPPLVKLPLALPIGMECTPVVYNGLPLLVENNRPGGAEANGEDAYLYVMDLTTGQEITRCGQGHSFVSGFVNGPELNLFATEFAHFGRVMEMKGINRFSTTDLKTWTREPAIAPNEGEQIFNSSVCQDDQGYLMAYETCVPPKWAFRFARSKDLTHWEKIPDLQFYDEQHESVCGNPTIRYVAPYYYVLYGIHSYKNGPDSHFEYQLPATMYVTLIARSKDLVTWDISPTRRPMLDPVPGEGVNNTDADLFEFEGNTYIYYATGDQSTWDAIRVAMYAGPMKTMLEAYFPEGAPMMKMDARRRAYIRQN